MTDSSIDTIADETQDSDSADVNPEEVGGDKTDARPEGLPDKFWDPEGERVRTDALAKSYRELEQKLGGTLGRGVPETPDGYEIQLDDPRMEVDPNVNHRLHEAGFNQRQAQVVYDLAREYLAPIVDNLSADLAAEQERDRLVEHFGGPNRWRETAAQLREWGKANLPRDAFESMASSYDGVLKLQHMMTNDEPDLLRDGQAAESGLSERGLKDLMRDPRYWRDHEPAVVQQVKDGFARLYPEKE